MAEERQRDERDITGLNHSLNRTESVVRHQQIGLKDRTNSGERWRFVRVTNMKSNDSARQ
jgi:hypothetical protein